MFQKLYKINLASLSTALKTNRFLSNAQVGFAGEGMKPPSPFQMAFASFSFNLEGDPPKMVLYNPNDEGWSRSDRYHYLQNVIFVSPHEKTKQDIRKVSFFQDQETKRIFCNYFDPESEIFYLIDGGEKIDVFEMLPLPKEKGHQIENVLYQISQNPAKMYDLTWEEFENVIAHILEKQGWSVEPLKRTKDGNIDILAIQKVEPVELHLMVQCKRFKPEHKVGVEIVRSVIQTQQEEHHDKAMIATTSSFTKGAMEKASLWNLSLTDQQVIIEWCKKYGRKIEPLIHLRIS